MFKELWYLIKLLFSNPASQKVEIVQMKHFPFQGYLAMSWCGKIITRKPEKTKDSVILNHERIHLEQALKLLENSKQKTWLKFYWEYIKEWIKGNPLIAPSSSAYYTIPFEMEAYGNEHNFDYKVTENSWRWYIINNRKDTYKKNRNNWKQFCKNLVK